MSIDANTGPVGLDDVSHIVCCKPDWGLCGRSVADLDFVPQGEPPSWPRCPSCAARVGQPCGKRFCLARRLWWGLTRKHWSTEYEKRSKR